MRIVVKVLTTITIIFVCAMISWFVLYENQPDVVEWEIPTFQLDSDIESGTLIVTDTNLNLNWEDISLEKGKATLPAGKVSPGDTITNCYGTIELSFQGSSIGSWTFHEEPEEIEEIRFLGNWEGSGRTVNFTAGSYSNSFIYADSVEDYESNNDGYYASIPPTSVDFDLAIQIGGTYDTQLSQIVVQDKLFNYTPVSYNVTFYDQDKKMKIIDPNIGHTWEFNRTFTPELYVEIVNTSEKFDTCIKSFVNNISNETYNITLKSGLNLSVKFEYELTDLKIDNITQEGVIFLNDSSGNITAYELNYIMQVDSLHDLYYLASRSDVELISADDSKFYEFGCT